MGQNLQNKVLFWCGGEKSTPLLKKCSGRVNSLAFPLGQVSGLLQMFNFRAAEKSWEGEEEVGGASGQVLPAPPLCSWSPKQWPGAKGALS